MQTQVPSPPTLGHRDEEFGGSLQHLASGSGGPMTPPAIARRVLWEVKNGSIGSLAFFPLLVL